MQIFLLRTFIIMWNCNKKYNYFGLFEVPSWFFSQISSLFFHFYDSHQKLDVTFFWIFNGLRGWGGGGCWRCLEVALFRLRLQPAVLWVAVAFYGLQQACLFWPLTLGVNFLLHTNCLSRDCFLFLGPLSVLFRATEFPFLSRSVASSWTWDELSSPQAHA